MLKFFLVLIAASMLIAVAGAASGSPEEVSQVESSVHFILLIDDSGDMRGGHKEVLLNALPRLLFEGNAEGRQVNPAFPKYQAGRDSISVVYFTIHSGGACTAEQGNMSALPEDIFSFEGELNVNTQEQLTNSLRDGLDKTCRFSGKYSPIATAPVLVLPYLQKHLKHDRMYSKTFLIVATNGNFNTRISPSIELETFRRDFGITGTEAASQTAYDVSRLFYFNSAPGWYISLNDKRDYLLVSEVTPLPLPDSVISYQRSINLDRQAISNDRLRVAPGAPNADDLRLFSRREGAAYSFLPLSLEMKFQDARGGAWQIGERTFPASISVDLKDCQPPRCMKDESKTVVPFFTAAGESLTISSREPELSPGQINFNVGLRYQTNLYDHIFVKSLEQRIDLAPVPASTLPGYFFFLPDVKLDNRELASQWTRDADGVITQEEAKNLILSRRKWYNVFTILLVIASLVALFLYLFRNKYHRPFKPTLEWQPSSEVVVDFNRPAASRLLVGALKVINREEVPWFGRKLKNEEQPTRNALFSLSYNFFKEHEFELNDGNPIGFLRAQANGNGENIIGLHTEEVISDGKQIYIFLAADIIRDFSPSDTNGSTQGHDFQIDLAIQGNWRSHDSGGSDGNTLINRVKSWWAVGDQGTFDTHIECPLTIKPEESRKPKVVFRQTVEQRLYFKKGEAVQIGSFLFDSQAQHNFAQPFSWGDYTVQAYRENRPLSGQPIVLAQPRVVVPPYDLAEVPVYLVCDGETVVNPEPTSNFYTFKLIGDFDAGSEPGPHSMMLYRDPTVCEIELKVLYPEPRREVYWASDSSLNQRLLLPDGSGAEDDKVTSNTITLEARTIEFDTRSGRTPDLLRLEIGNSGTAGTGLVKVEMSTRIVCDEVVEAGIDMADDRHLDDLLGVYSEEVVNTRVMVEEGGRSQVRDVRIQPGLITKIKSAIIPANKLAAQVDLNIVVKDDQGRENQRRLTFIVPVKLEQLPGLNWLCIDFGTSAIAVALGTGREGGIRLIPLQEVMGRDGFSLAKQDIDNAEIGDPHLLPSWIICDADERKKSNKPKQGRPGFPEYLNENLSLTPGEPDFVGLPATSRQFVEEPERIIYSMKSWLAKASSSIPLRTKITYKEDGKLVNRDTLPLDKVVESGLAALAEAYLLVHPDYRADQIVLCHPNTFTQRHRELLHDIALRALGREDRFGIPLPGRIRLISESDAVAYYYCKEQMRKRPRSGKELILIYDFGAGTLDLSLIEVEWKRDPVCYPVGWKILGRIGVPVAGNYFDEVLARIIDDQLADQFLNNYSLVNYKYPVVRRSVAQEKTKEYLSAIMRLWGHIREAKHKWDGVAHFKVRVGYIGGYLDIVDSINEATNEKLKESEEPSGDVAGLWADRNSIYLSIPASRIHDDQRMKEFIGFVTTSVIDELCDASNISPHQVDAVVVSGRGALWPGLCEQIWARFPQAERPNLFQDRAMKDAVVYGAIARQELMLEDDVSYEAQWRPKLGVLINNDEDLILEGDWDKPIDLTRSPTFRIVQVNLKDPDPRNDIKPSSLRKHFYIDLTDQPFRREGVWARTKELYVRKEEGEGKLAIYLEDREGRQRIPIFTQARSAETVTSPPWPVGPDFILEP